MEIVHFRAMNTDIFLAAEGKPRQLVPAFEKAKQFILESERRFTRFSPESELSQLNRSAGTWFHASPDLLSVVMLAQFYVAQTHGLFDPSILPDLQRVGYDRTMDLIRAKGAIASIEIPIMSTRQRVSLNGLTVNSEENLIYLPSGQMLDLGGIAKGWIAEQAAGILAEFSPACAVNAGGDMFLVGLPEAEEAWQIALEDPRTPDQVLAMLHIPPGAVATSSITRRTWKQDEKQRHHLIDPRTGEPAVTDWLSVTVISPHADLSEVFAKALLIAGPQNAEIISQEEKEIAYLAVNRDGQIVGTPKSLEYIV